jgi:hypothetical protein
MSTQQQLLDSTTVHCPLQTTTCSRSPAGWPPTWLLSRRTPLQLPSLAPPTCRASLAPCCPVPCTSAMSASSGRPPPAGGAGGRCAAWQSVGFEWAYMLRACLLGLWMDCAIMPLCVWLLPQSSAIPSMVSHTHSARANGVDQVLTMSTTFCLSAVTPR